MSQTEAENKDTIIGLESIISKQLHSQAEVPEETITEVREQKLRPVTDLPKEPNNKTETKEIIDDTVQKRETSEVLTPQSFKDAMDMLTVIEEEDDTYTLEELSKNCSRIKYIIRDSSVKGVTWVAKPRLKGKRPLTDEQSKQLADKFNAVQKEMRPTKSEAESSLEEGLASLIAVIEDISDSKKLQDFSERCAQKNMLYGGTTEKGFWVKAIKGSEISKKLVVKINQRKAELAKSERIGILINEIKEAKDPRELEKLAFTLHKLDLIKKETTGRGWKVEAIEGVNGSKELVKAIIKKRVEMTTFREQMNAIEDKQNEPELEKTVQRLHYAGYVIKTGKGRSFKVTAGKRFGGKQLTEAIMKKKGEFLDQGLKASIGEILEENIGK